MPRSEKRSTIAEVARLAGVSATTVSHALTGNQPVSAEARQRVERAVAKVGYRPSAVARSLRTQRTNTVALIIPDITNPFYPMLARGLNSALEGEYRTLICFTDGQRDRERSYLHDVVDRQVDGIVLVAFQIVPEDLGEALDRRIPIVSLGETPDEDLGIDVVASDDAHGSYAATRHLVRRHHRRIGIIRGVDGPGPVRTEGYRRALDEAGLGAPPELEVTGDWTRAGGADAMRRLLELDDPPTAVFCTNDLMAIGALDAARTAEVRVPHDLAVVGYDDIDAAALVHPALTTVVNPSYEAGREAGRLLLDRMSREYSGPSRSVMLRSRLVERESA